MAITIDYSGPPEAMVASRGAEPLQESKRLASQALQVLPSSSRGNANGTAAAVHLTLALLGAAFQLVGIKHGQT